MSGDDELFSILEAHGQRFLQSFDLPNPSNTSKRKTTNGKTRLPSLKRARTSHGESSSEEEWSGIQRKAEDSENDSDSNINSDVGSPNFDQYSDDGFTAGGTIDIDEKTVIFAENKFETGAVSKAQMKAFMSSKISKLRDDGVNSSLQKDNQAEEEERTNAENDALLHKLVYTQLLSGSLSPDLDMTPAHRRKALAGRVLELAEEVKLGKGEKAVREAERNKAGKRVREGLARKQRQREAHDLEEAKNQGNYHPALKRLFEASGASTSRSKSRGLKMGVGNFRGGVLQLSKQDIASVTGGSGRAGGKQGRKRR